MTRREHADPPPPTRGPSGPDRVRAQRVVVIGVLTSVGLGLVKLLAGVFGHSYALIADAVESFTDVLAAAVIWGGLHVSSRPASERHPYGYGKAEALAALIVSLLILAAGVAIGVQSVREVITPHKTPAAWTLLVLASVIVVKETLFRFMRAEARRGGGDAIETDAWHHRSDAITSLAAFVGISIAVVGGPGWEIADDIAALFASSVIVWNALRLLRAPVRELLDAQSESIADRAATIARGVEGVRRVEKAMSRKSGVAHFVDMHIWVDADLSVREAHLIAHRVKDAIRASAPTIEDVLIHIEPDDDNVAGAPE